MKSPAPRSHGYARRSAQRIARRSSFRPCLEFLEDRSLPSTDIWSGAGGNNNWSNPANWVGNIAPHAGDDLVFPGGAARTSPANDFSANTTFNSITIAGSTYTLSGNAITLLAGLTDSS